MKRLNKLILSFLSLSMLFTITVTNKEIVDKPVDDLINSEVISRPSLDSDLEVEIESETNKPQYIKKTKVYINPSVQTSNLYINGKGNEATNMNDVARFLKRELDKIEFLEVLYNLDNLPLKKSVDESNKFDADIHLALHTNAGGGRGSEIYTINSNDFSKTIYDDFNELGNFKKRGIKNGSHLYEVKNSKAEHVALMEFLFHDNYEEANWIVNNKELIAKQLAKSIINFVSVYYYATNNK